MYLDEPDWRAPFFPRSPHGSEKLRVALHLGSGSEKKNWPVENWREVVAAVRQERPDVELILITGEAELERGVSTAEFQADAHWQAMPLAELAERLGSCDLFLGHDSGISHLASACGVPCLLLFGPTDPEIWSPPQSGVTVIQAEKGDWKQLQPDKVILSLMKKLSEIR